MTRRQGLAAMAAGAALLLAGAVLANGDLLRAAAAGLQQVQQELHRDLAAGIRGIGDHGPLAAGSLVAISFLYGVVHAAGPGHGKAVISAYVLADARRCRRGLVLAWAAAMLQALTAIGLVWAVVHVAGAATRDAQPAVLLLERVGYGLMAAVGAAMIWSCLRRSLGPSVADHGSAPCGHAGCGHSHAPPPTADGASSWRSAAVIVSVGLRPCSGALLVLAFSQVLGVFYAGVMATFAMAVGTAITVSVLALLALGSRHLAFALVSADARWLRRVEIGLVLFGGVALTALASILFLGTFQPAGGQLPFR